MNEASDRGPPQSRQAAPKAGDKLATEAFVRSHAGWMLRLARSYLADTGLAEDAVQTAFAKVFEKGDQFEGRSDLRTWMRRVVVNEALMILRKRKASKEDPSVASLMPAFDANDCRIEASWRQPQSPEQILMTEETRRSVIAAIGRLPETYRVILLLRDIEEKTTAEVAEVLGISEANVKVRLHRARAALKALLEPEMRAGRFSK